jgi:uncharacterized membrane-anchored protein
MSGTHRYFWPLLIVVALAQSAALFKIVYDKDRLLKTGREITMPVKPLDPRDIFRGDYVTLGYDISTLNTSDVPIGNFANFPAGSAAYVTLSPNPAGGWAVAAVAPEHPATVAPTDVVLKGRVDRVWRAQTASDSVINMRYGIETYFVPEGTGRALESKVREHQIDAIVAVGPDGTAVLKGLVVDGERHVDPPLL